MSIDNLNYYEQLCFKALLESSPEIIKLIKSNNKKTDLSINIDGDEELRTTIRVDKNIWDKFITFSQAFPYSKKDLLSQALKEFMSTHEIPLNEQKQKMFSEINNILNDIKNNSITTSIVENLILFIRQHEKILTHRQKKLILTLLNDIFSTDVRISNKTRFLENGDYFSGNLRYNNTTLNKLKTIFQTKDFDLNNIIQIIVYAISDVENADLDFILRIPEVVIRDNAYIEIPTNQLSTRKNECYNNLRNIVLDIESSTNEVLYSIINREFKVPYISEKEIDKYEVYNSTNIHIFRPYVLEKFHLLVASRGNYNNARKFLFNNNITQEFDDKSLDDLYYYLNQIEFEYSSKEKELLKTLNFWF